MATTDVRLHMVGRNLPGSLREHHEDVYLGIQRRSEVIDLGPSHAPDASFDLAVVAKQLDWTRRRDDTEPVMLARIKLFLGNIDRDLIDDALQHGNTLQGSLARFGPGGWPVSGGIHPPDIQWTRPGEHHA